ncbi:ribosome biogenesis GTP-binding protein YihA/YsxC [Stella sp.]|uniref:ribosome biogenesis GTP-binding protein YihA/YsxC n=1 Tax=Stella sp. TaxID=2912054 RepID=UPI0035AEA5A2
MTAEGPSVQEAPELDAEAIEAGRLLFAQECGFFWASTTAKDLPPIDLPEVAFLGRSNVGKSSLINALTGRNALARTSNTPGRTRQLNFFRLGDRLTLVDMPGYGYAKVSRSETAAWVRMIDAYLRGRPTLQRLCLLVDARHGLKDSDRGWMKMLDQAAVSYQVVLTKADEPRREELARTRAAVAKEAATHVAAHPVVLETSARGGIGIPELRAMLARLADPPAT